MEKCVVRLREKIGFVGAIGCAAVLAAGIAASGQTADQAWLRYGPQSRTARLIVPRNMRALGSSALRAVRDRRTQAKSRTTLRLVQSPARRKAAVAGETVVGTAEEVRKAYPNLPVPADLGPDGYWLYSNEPRRPRGRSAGNCRWRRARCPLRCICFASPALQQPGRESVRTLLTTHFAVSPRCRSAGWISGTTPTGRSRAGMGAVDLL